MPHYVQDQSLKNLAEGIIKVHRPKLALLKICYVFRDEAIISDGHVISGMCTRVDDRNWTIHNFDFVIEIAKDLWDQATDDFKHALMDHELGHVGIVFDEDGAYIRDEVSGRIKTRCRKHDIEEFEEIMERHGTYHKALRDFISAFGRFRELQKKKPAGKRAGTQEEPEE